MVEIFVIYCFILAATYLGVWWFRHWSLKRRWLDIPNERSSHERPTPRGGGIIVSVICLTAFLTYLIFNGKQVPWAYFVGAILVMGISWLDDLKTISPGWRLLCHSLAASVVVLGLRPLSDVQLFPQNYPEIAWLANVLVFFWIVWVTNAYNFMDGIDGIAGMQAFTAGLGWSILGFWGGFESVGFYGGVLAACAIGFLFHNWSPAKVFLGDVGSAFLGYTFAVMPFLVLERSDAEMKLNFLLIAALLVWFFLFDSVLTLLLRVWRRERVWEAHRSHIYQRLVRGGFSHQQVTLLYGVLSFLLVLVLFLVLRDLSRFLVWVVLFAVLEATLLLGVLRKNSFGG